MKISFFKVLLMMACSLGTSMVFAGSNNGYTTAANVYSGSSSRGWYGGGVAHTLAGWKNKQEKVATPAETPTVEKVEEEAPAEKKEEVTEASMKTADTASSEEVKSKAATVE